MADWLGIDSSHLDSFCGEEPNSRCDEALDGTDCWFHISQHTHWMILDLGSEYNVQKVRGRSNGTWDPTDVNIYVSNNKEDWGAAVATGISTWRNTNEWQEVDVTDKDGRYIKVEIVANEEGMIPYYCLTFGCGTPFQIFDVYGALPATIVEPATLALALTQHAPGVVVDCTVTPATLALALTQHAPSLAFDYTVTPDALALALTQHAPSLAFDYTVTPDALVLELTQQALTISIDYTLLPDALELALTQHAPTIGPFITITPATLELALTQHAPSLTFDYTVTPDTLALALTQHDPVISINITLLPATLNLALALWTPEIVTRFGTIPSFMLKDLIDPYSGGAWLWLAEISLPGYDIVRKARNTADINYNGTNFPKGNFDVGRQSLSGDGSIPRIVLRVAQDPDHVLEDIVNATKGGADGTVKLIRTCEKFLDTPVDALEAEYDILIAGSDVEWVTFSLGIPNPLTQRIPLWLYSSKVCPLATPSLFKGPRCQYVGGDTVCTGLLEDCYAKGNAVHWGAEIGLDPNAVRV